MAELQVKVQSSPGDDDQTSKQRDDAMMKSKTLARYPHQEFYHTIKQLALTHLVVLALAKALTNKAKVIIHFKMNQW